MNTRTQQELKQQVAKAALEHIPEHCVLGVGSGSTVECFIALLPSIQSRIEACVAGSERSARQLKVLGLPVLDLNSASEVHLLVDGADACNMHKQLIKGGGGALTREKILAIAADHFLCIMDETKLGSPFLEHPIPIEVIPMARSLVARHIIRLGGKPVYRQGFITDNQNVILDIEGLTRDYPIQLEQALKQITGLVDSGLFAQRLPDDVLVSYFSGKLAKL